MNIADHQAAFKSQQAGLAAGCQLGPAIPAPVSEIQSLVDRLDRTHSNLMELDIQLSNRLAPVLSKYGTDQTNGAAAGAAPAPVASCGLAAQLAELCDRYEAIAVSLSAKLDTLAI